MHSLHHIDLEPITGNEPEIGHLLAKARQETRPTLAGRILSFARTLKSWRGFYRQEMAGFEYGDHPDADNCRLRLRTVERMMEELVRVEIMPAGYLTEDPAPVWQCSITTPAPVADICHGREVRA